MLDHSLSYARRLENEKYDLENERAIVHAELMDYMQKYSEVNSQIGVEMEKTIQLQKKVQFLDGGKEAFEILPTFELCSLSSSFLKQHTLLSEVIAIRMKAQSTASTAFMLDICMICKDEDAKSDHILLCCGKNVCESCASRWVIPRGCPQCKCMISVKKMTGVVHK